MMCRQYYKCECNVCVYILASLTTAHQLKNYPTPDSDTMAIRMSAAAATISLVAFFALLAVSQGAPRVLQSLPAINDSDLERSVLQFQ